jgi:hypothetical protein
MDSLLPKERGFAGHWDQRITAEHFQSRLKQVVTIHRAMFDKFLFTDDALPPELVALLQDAGATYLELSREIEDFQRQSGSILNSSLKPES